MSRVEGRCHCGSVRLSLAHAPTDINDCQCGHCQKRGVLWAYYSPAQVSVSGPTSIYSWGDKGIGFHFCPQCGCTTHWRALDLTYDRMAINTRLLEPEAVAGAIVRTSPGPR